MLLSSEAWHKVHKYQIEKLEDVDKMFLRKLLNSHAKTGIEFLFSESGSIPLNLKISVRRLLYWWHILSTDKSEMINKVYAAQKLSPISGDWVNLLYKDKEMFQIELTDEEVYVISKQKFKAYVKKKSVELTVEYLLKLKKQSKKSKHLDVREFGISPYLIDSRFSKEDRELLFKLRSRTISVKDNFRNAFIDNDMLCELCRLFPCTQSHVLSCPSLQLSMVVEDGTKLNDNYIYGDLEQQLLYVKIYKNFWELRENLLNKIEQKE